MKTKVLAVVAIGLMAVQGAWAKPAKNICDDWAGLAVNAMLMCEKFGLGSDQALEIARSDFPMIHDLYPTLSRNGAATIMMVACARDHRGRPTYSVDLAERERKECNKKLRDGTLNKRLFYKSD